jgi:hypothetical protein
MTASRDIVGRGGIVVDSVLLCVCCWRVDTTLTLRAWCKDFSQVRYRAWYVLM